MLKKIWNVIQYIILIIVIVATAKAIYLRSLVHILGGAIFVLFWITMILENKSPKKNKVISGIYYITSAIILVVNIIAIVYFYI